MNDPLPKISGADFELGNFLTGYNLQHGTGYDASRLLLQAMPGVRCREEMSWGWGRDGADGETLQDEGSSQDWGRKFLGNGGCAYVDLNHLELCIPEVLSAHDHVAATHALLRMAGAAARVVNAELPKPTRVVVLANNSDGLGHAYGSHLNFLMARPAWEDLFHRRLQLQLFLASYQASSLVFAGQGKVGSENDQPPVDYQISQRADFVEVLASPQTTFRRPLVNSRDEPLCGRVSSHPARPGSELREGARLHVIFYDHNLCHGAGLLKVGVMQLVLAMLESGCHDPSLLLDDPVRAVQQWSHDPSLRVTQPLLDGRAVTAVEHQLGLLERVADYVEAELDEELVPRARDLLDLWADTLDKLHRRDFAALTGRLDWVLKRSLLDQARRAGTGFSWQSDALKHLDHLYASLDPDSGLFWACQRAGLTEEFIPDNRIRHFQVQAPEETRAWTRGHLLRRVDPAWVESVDWDRMVLRDPDHAGRRLSLTMADPLQFSRHTTCGLDLMNAPWEEVLDRLGAVASSSPPLPAQGTAISAPRSPFCIDRSIFLPASTSLESPNPNPS